ncbi:hypothetical protein B296_00038933 [Ensete ventricosum]|uniref:Uncharacterized protein n=1 Tax=Ensete ventricosum TaxID=4639 RepID=A0A426Y045_ENSVE|nr:hypothetical protein B296_00038933 [Ensete ventricosum]
MLILRFPNSGIIAKVRPPVGMAGACRGDAHGGAYGHNAYKSYRPRGCCALLPIGAAVLAVKGAAHGQGDRWMRAEGESYGILFEKRMILSL